VQARFHELVTQIDEAFNGGVPEETRTGPAVIFRPGSVVEETLEANSVMFFIVPLPRRKVEMIVNMVKLSGAMPELFGSDTETRPRAKNHEIEAEGGEILYRYDPDLQARTALYLGVETSEHPSSFRLRSAIRRFAGDGGEDANPSGSLTSARNRIAQKLAEINKDNLTRDAFKEREQEAKAHMRRKGACDKNFTRINQQKVQDWADGLDVHNQKLAALHNARLALVERRREEVEEAREHRMNWWVDKFEVRRLEKEEEARLEQEALMQVKRRQDWLIYLTHVSFAMTLFNSAREEKARREMAHKIANAVQTIQRCALRSISAFRRRKLYRNVIKMRLAVIAMARQMRPNVNTMAQDRLQWFLNLHLHSRAEPSVSATIKRYMNAVRKVQRAFRRGLMIRAAQTEALMNHFSQENLVKHELAILMEDTRLSPEAKATIRKSLHSDGSIAPAKTKSPGKASEVPKPGKAAKKVEKPKAESKPEKRRGAVVMDFNAVIPDYAPAWVLSYQGEEILPLYLRKHVIRLHVGQMHGSYRRRIAEWEKKKQELALDIELSKMQLGEKSAQLKEIEFVPQVVEVRRIRGLFHETYNCWMNGGFKEMRHNRRRQESWIFELWKRTHRGLAEEADVTQQAFFSSQELSKELSTDEMPEQLSMHSLGPAEPPGKKGATTRKRGTLVRSSVANPRSSLTPRR